MKKFDFTLHFTIKGQKVPDISSKLEDWLVENKEIIDLSERAEGDPNVVLHHCFLPEKIVIEKGFSTDVIDLLNELAEDQVCWYGVDGDLGMSRLLMLQNIKRLNGISIFVGEIKEGVKDEYDLAKEMGIECVLIP